MWLRRVHKFLGVVICLPALLWGLSGALLAWKNWAHDAAPLAVRAQPVTKRPYRYHVAQVLAAMANSRPETPLAVEWHHLAETPYYLLRYDEPPSVVLIDGETGKPQAGVNAEQARRIAAAAVPEAISITECVLQSEPSLVYLRGMELPVFRVSLSDGSAMYISPETGEVQFRAPRSAWVIRFAFYGLHVFKWSSGPGPHHSYLVLLGLSLLLCASSLSGLWLWLRSGNFTWRWPRSGNPRRGSGPRRA